MSQNNFPERLIKGRIAETVFEMMFREATDFDIYPLGYEHTMPILSQFRDDLPNQKHKDIIEKIINNFNDTPDFLIVKPNKSELYVVEVKYRPQRVHNEVLGFAKDINKKWDPAWLFLATKEGFFFDAANDILHHKPQISPLNTNWVASELQGKYLKLIQEFEK